MHFIVNVFTFSFIITPFNIFYAATHFRAAITTPFTSAAEPPALMPPPMIIICRHCRHRRLPPSSSPFTPPAVISFHAVYFTFIDAADLRFDYYLFSHYYLITIRVALLCLLPARTAC